MRIIYHPLAEKVITPGGEMEMRLYFGAITEGVAPPAT
jgi:hypothetical protein